MKAEENESKKKWITDRGFKTFVGGKMNMLGSKEKYSDVYHVAADKCELRGED